MSNTSITFPDVDSLATALGVEPWLMSARGCAYLAVFGGELRDYEDEGHRDLNAPPEARFFNRKADGLIHEVNR